jgi:hypothetical protein
MGFGEFSPPPLSKEAEMAGTQNSNIVKKRLADWA